MVARPRTPPRRRVQQRGADTRLRILQAALKAFANHGFDGAMTRDIAADAGVHQPVINYHFEGKEGLWQAAVDCAFAELSGTFAARLREIGRGDPVQTMRALLRDFVLFNARHPEFARVLVHEASAPSPRLAWVVERHLRPMHASVAALIAKMQRAGYWKTISAESVYHIMNGAAASIFVMAPAVALTTGTNPLAEKHSSAHADAVVELFFPHTRAAIPRKASGARRGQSRRTVRTGSSRQRRRNS